MCVCRDGEVGCICIKDVHRARVYIQISLRCSGKQSSLRTKYRCATNLLCDLMKTLFPSLSLFPDL